MAGLRTVLRAFGLFVAVGAAPCARAAVFDAAADFSIGNGNPNGVWTYGYSLTLGGDFVPYTTATNAPYPPYAPTTFIAWQSGIAAFGNEPLVMKNISPNTEQAGDINLEGGQLSAHPGPNGEYSLIRWTAPTNGAYRIAVEFEGRSVDGTTTDVHLLSDDGIAIFNGDIDGFLDEARFSAVFQLKAGEHFDVAVGVGANDYNSDTTGVDFVVRSVPAPASIALFSPLIILLWRRRRRARNA